VKDKVGFGSGSPVDSPPEFRATNPEWVASRRPAASRGCLIGARERFHSQGLDNGVSSLTPRAVWFVGLCHICRRCSSSDRDTGKTPVQRHTGSRGPGTSQSIRRSTSTFPDSSLGVHRSPLRRHDHHCVVTRLGRRPDFGSGLPRPDRVPLLPFLPASAVCYAASRSEDPLVRRSAGLLHPAADHGVRQVSDSLARPRSRADDPKVVDPKVLGSLPLWRRPFEAFPSSAAVDHAVTAPRPFGRDRVHRLAFPLAVRAAPACVSPRRAVLLSTSGLSSTEESVAFVRRCRLATARMGFATFRTP
jgi:hypothetical protein